MNAELSIVIATRDQPESIARLARSLAEISAECPNIEVIAINDGGARRCETPFRTELARCGWRVQFLHEDHRGPGAARNLALTRCSAAHALFLDDDCIVRAGMLTAMRQAMASDPAAVLVANSRWMARTPLSDFQHTMAHRRHSQVDCDGAASLERLDSCGWCAPVAAIRDAGGFPEGFVAPPLETWVLGWKLAKNGLAARLVLDAIVEHEFPERGSDFLRKRHRIGASLKSMSSEWPAQFESILQEAASAAAHRSGFLLRWRRRLALRDEFPDHAARWGLALLRGMEELPLEGWTLPDELPKA